MMATIIRQNPISFGFFKNSSSSLCNSDVVFSQFLLHFSTLVTASEISPLKHRSSPAVSVRNPKKSDLVISFLKQTGFSKTQVEKLVKTYPHLHSANLENTIKPKIMIFQDLGFSSNDAVAIISHDPWILKQSLNKKIIPSLSTLKRLLGSNEQVAKLLKRYGGFLKTNLDNNMVQNVEILKNCGVDMKQIIPAIYRFPMFILRKPELVKKLVDKADEMGVSRSSRMFYHAVRILSCMTEDTWKLRVRAFRELGFSEKDVEATFRSSPLVLGVSETKIKEVKEVLLATGKYKMSCIVKDPISLMYSVEKRYKPRIRVLEVLESRNVIVRWPCLSVLCRVSEKDFFEKFVGPYLDHVGNVYVASTRKGDVEQIEDE
ncbi:hypothetical protein ACP275_14G287700 [Erythranthe tilingii]